MNKSYPGPAPDAAHPRYPADRELIAEHGADYDGYSHGGHSSQPTAYWSSLADILERQADEDERRPYRDL